MSGDKDKLFTEEELLRSQLRNSEWFLRRMGNQLFHLQSVNYHVIRNVDTLTATESLDALSPFDMDFYIDPDTEQVISAKVVFKIKPYRAYSKTVASGGQTTTAAGGGTTVTSASGGGGTITSQSGGGGTVTSQSSSAHITVVTAIGTENYDADSWLITENPSSPGNPAIYNAGAASPIHTHDVDLPSHSHYVSLPNHQHDVTIPDHQHDIGPHTHDIDFGIHEQTPSSPTLNIYLSNNGYDFDVFLGSYTSDSDIEFGTKILGTGWKAIRFEGNELMRVTAYIILKTDIKVG